MRSAEWFARAQQAIPGGVSSPVRAFRAVTDSRASVDDRGKAYLLRFRLYPIYGSDGWNCVDREPAPGE